MNRIEEIELIEKIGNLERKARIEYLKYTDWTEVIAMLSKEDEEEYWNLMDKLYESRGEEE
tara:strand:- start:408 stop:590 length:183 start_codon:yes stop_codon:yes gene_type:complete